MIPRIFARCQCAAFEDVELHWNAVEKRIRESRKLVTKLRLIHGDWDSGVADTLHSCDSCGQLWQGSFAWAWGENHDNPRYLFKVPIIDLEEWRQTPFIRPHELLTFSAAFENVSKGLTEKQDRCKHSDCQQRAVTYSVFCLRHHIESLQAIGRFPSSPSGRWFQPYEHLGLVRS
jgi:hypothetical protein